MSQILRASPHTVLKFAGAGIGARQVRAIVSTGQVDRMGDIVVQSGIDVSRFRQSPTVLWGHNSDAPIARAVDIALNAGKLEALVQFPDEGLSAKSDEIYALIKSGVVNSTSIGFMPLESEPLDPKQPWGAQRYKRIELLEFSFVSIPANADARITERSASKTPRLDAAKRRLAAMR
jgi:HK97 family phage prohead protease